jgi:hypothetical protein
MIPNSDWINVKPKAGWAQLFDMGNRLGGFRTRLGDRGRSAASGMKRHQSPGGIEKIPRCHGGLWKNQAPFDNI